MEFIVNPLEASNELDFASQLGAAECSSDGSCCDSDGKCTPVTY
jgi:hypothetical protein